MAARVERVSFRGSQGEDLAARLDLPATPPSAYVLPHAPHPCGVLDHRHH